MARKKAAVEGEKKAESFNVEKYIGSMKNAQDLYNRKESVVSVSPALDRGLSGGILEGTITIIAGPEKCGKTTTCMQILANGQKPEFGKRKIFYANIESRLRKIQLSIHDITLDDIGIIESDGGIFLTAEKYFTIFEELLKRNPGCILVIDSMSALVSDTEYGNKYEDRVMDSTGRLQNLFFRRNISTIQKNRNIILSMVHLCADPGNPSGTRVKASSALKYYHDNFLLCRSFGKGKPPFSDWLNGEEKKIGQIARWKIMNSAIGPPGANIESYIKYNYGIDEVTEMIQLATADGIIHAGGGGNYSFNYGSEEIKGRGFCAFRNEVANNEDALNYLKSIFCIQQ